ncbi:MAG TPA: DUF3108 domain-containing protein [Pseudohongiella sp.]|nr:DUF3108 domain-containing protein [Pseudohongiella sp.]
MSHTANRRIPLTLVSHLFAAALLASGLPVFAQNGADIPRPAPSSYEALYEARAVGMRSTAWRRLTRSDDGSYQLEHGLSASVLGANLITVEESSRFRWDEGGAVPLEYHYKQSGVRRRSEQVVFDYEQGLALMKREDRENSVALEQRILDDLSFSAQLSADLLADPSLQATDTVLSYPIVDARRLETHEYRVMGQETISTGAGELEAIKLERIRDAGSDRSTVLWLAPANQFTLARLMQIENGSTMELTLTEISWQD